MHHSDETVASRVFARRSRWLEVVCWALAVQGLTWMVFGSFDPMGVYDHLLAEHLYGLAELPPPAAEAFAFAMIPFGATDAAYFALVGAVVRYGFPTRQPWTWWAVVGSFSLWLVADTAGSMWVGAWFNVALVNLPCALLVLPLMTSVRRWFYPDGSSDRE